MTISRHRLHVGARIVLQGFPTNAAVFNGKPGHVAAINRWAKGWQYLITLDELLTVRNVPWGRYREERTVRQLVLPAEHILPTA